MPYHSMPITPNRKTSITDPKRNRSQLLMATERAVLCRKCSYFTTAAGERFSFCPAASPDNGSTTAQPMRNHLHLSSYFLQWTFIFLLLITSLSHPTFYKSLSSCITPQSTSLLARWAAARFNNYLIKPHRSSNYS